jgi:hypothetical protein
VRRILSDYESHHNQHRPHRSLSGAAPLRPLPRAGRSRPVPHPKTSSGRWLDQRISPGGMTWTRLSARTGSGPCSVMCGRPA